jgi:hypothetical protein
MSLWGDLRGNPPNPVMVSLIHSPYVGRFFSSLHLTMAHSPIHDAVIPPSLFLEGNSPESRSSKDVE